MYYEVVCTKSYLDIGLLLVEHKGVPKRVKSATTKFSTKTEYGYVECFLVKTGVFLTEKEWDEITYEKTTEEIIKILKINKKEVKDMSKKIVNGLEVNGENIITSLKIIKQVCEDNQSTNGKNCPFNVDTDSNCKECLCGITDLEPDNWKILEYTRFQALG